MNMPPNTIPAGATRLRTLLANYLKAELPPLLAAARQQLEIEEFMIPTPKRYDSYDPLSANVFPIIGAYINRTTNWTRVDINELAEEVYEARYQCGVFIWVRTPETPQGEFIGGYEGTVRLRDDMVALLRSVLLSRPSLGSNGVVAMDEATVSEDYPDAIKSNDQSPRWLAGGIINCEFKVREANYLPRLATANTVVVEAEPIQEEETP